MYELKYRRATAKYIRQTNRLLREKLKEELDKIKDDPHLANPLTGEFKGLWSYHFTFKGTSYRIIFEIFPKNLIVVELIGPRENIYKRLRRIR